MAQGLCSGRLAHVRRICWCYREREENEMNKARANGERRSSCLFYSLPSSSFSFLRVKRSLPVNKRSVPLFFSFGECWEEGKRGCGITEKIQRFCWLTFFRMCLLAFSRSSTWDTTLPCATGLLPASASRTRTYREARTGRFTKKASR